MDAICVYCGEPADTKDHLVPTAWITGDGDVVTHACNAWCHDDLHAGLFSTNDERSLIGCLFEKDEPYGVVEIVAQEPASPEAEPDPKAPASYQYKWVLWWRSVAVHHGHSFRVVPAERPESP